MWKYVSRRIRDTIERVNYFDKRSTTGLANSTNPLNDNCTKGSSNTPCRWFFAGKCWDPYFQRENNANNKRWNYEHLNNTWLGAITWSSALVLGWYASQLIHLKHKYRCNEEQKCNVSVRNLFNCLSPYIHSVNQNALYVESIPKIEKVVSQFTPTVHLVTNGDSGTSTVGSASSTSPDSSENDLGEVLNSIENKLGLAAIENGNHQEGLNLLRSAANRNHAPALYNLGLCYELGLGVPADEKMSMELYKSAATLEHAGALYNLGIYYGQGRGGLVKDTVTATRLLRLAAVKGQQDAIKALKSLDLDTESKPHKNIDAYSYNYMPQESRLYSDNISNHFQVYNCNAAVY